MKRIAAKWCNKVIRMKTVLSRHMHLFNENIKRFLSGNYIRAWIDAAFSFAFFGASPDDYFRYEFYRKSLSERRKFITYRKSKKIIKKYNSHGGNVVGALYDKGRLNEYLSNFIKRDWIDFDKCSDKQIMGFVKKYGRVIVKPKGGYGGNGIFTMTENDLNADTKLIERCKNCVAEEMIVQHGTLNKLNPASVNTLRVMTFDGEILSCVLKIGGGDGVMDNMCSGGLYGNVNTEYGITDSEFLDIELNRYILHPKTGEQLIGIQIPNWNKVAETVKSAAEVLSACRYLGWDIAVLENDVEIIEANYDPGHDLSCQSTVQRGIYQVIKELS